MYLVLEEKSAGGTLFSAFRAAWCRCLMRGVCSGFLVGTLFLCPRDGSQGGGGGGAYVLPYALCAVWVTNSCNQLLTEFSSNQFKTLYKYYKHIKDVHLTVLKLKFFFLKNYGDFDIDNTEVRFQ